MGQTYMQVETLAEWSYLEHLESRGGALESSQPNDELIQDLVNVHLMST